MIVALLWTVVLGASFGLTHHLFRVEHDRQAKTAGRRPASPTASKALRRFERSLLQM